MQNLQDLEGEIWKDIPGFPNIYQVSNIGNVISKDHTVKCKKHYTRIQYGRALKPKKTEKGYFNRALMISPNKKYTTGVHRLVALAFIPNPENKPQVNHINGIKTDNRVENLEWATQSENILHAIKNKLKTSKVGGEHHSSKLTDIQVSEIRNIYLQKKGNEKFNRKTISEEYNVSVAIISSVINNKTYYDSEYEKLNRSIDIIHQEPNFD